MVGLQHLLHGYSPTPASSSGLRSTPQPHSELSPSPSLPSADSSEGSLTPTGARKRGNDDLSSHVESIARRVKLKPDSTKTLGRVAKMSSDERELWLAGIILKTVDRLEEIQPPDASYKISSKLCDKVERLSIEVLLCPHLPAYKKVSTKILLDILERHPTWGLTKDVKDVKSKYKVVVERVQTRLTDRRSAIKSVLLTLCGNPNPDTNSSRRVNAKTLIELVQAVIKELYSDIGGEEIKMAVQICARFAYLRHIIMKHSGPTYWDDIDKALVKLHVQYTSDPIGLSGHFLTILRGDLAAFGDVEAELDDLADITPSDIQAEIEAFANDTPNVLDPVDDFD